MKSRILPIFSINYPPFSCYVYTRRGNPAVKEEDYVDWNSQLEEACTIVKKDAPREAKPFRFDTREQRIYLGHHLSDRKLLLRSLVSAVFFSAGER